MGGGGGAGVLTQSSQSISTATGSFLSATGVTTGSESDKVGTDSFTLQLNTNTVLPNPQNSSVSTVTQLCQNQSSAGCKGWQQYIYSQPGLGGDPGCLLERNLGL